MTDLPVWRRFNLAAGRELLSRDGDSIGRLMSWIGIAALSVIALCATFVYYSGQRVDESEIVLNALTIATGDWDPVWSPGYGHLAMYIPAFVLVLAAHLVHLLGFAADYQDALYLLFAGEGAFRISRFVYTMADFLTFLVLARIVRIVSASRILALLFVAYCLISPDTWYYATYIRSDTLVSLFVACAALTLVSDRNRLTPYLLGVSLGAAIACKYSAVTYVVLAGFLLLPLKGAPKSLLHRGRDAAVAVVIALVSTYIFQPLFDYSGILTAIQTHLSGSQFTHEVVPLKERLAKLYQLVLRLEPLVPLMALAMLAGALNLRRSAPVIAIALIGIAPFAMSNFPRDYWLIPFADSIRAAGWVGIGCLLVWIGDRFGRRMTLAVLLLAGFSVAFVAWDRYPSLAQPQRVNGSIITNADDAKFWLYANVANRSELIYIYEKNYQLPRAYSFSSIRDARYFSRVFIFRRDKFVPLKDMFRRYLYEKSFDEFSAITRIPRLVVGVPRTAEPPRLCSGEKCYPAKAAECTASAAKSISQCVAYSWDMDLPQFSRSLEALSLDLPGERYRFVACWYTCGDQNGSTPAFVGRPGAIPLERLGSRLFARASMQKLQQVQALDTRGREVYIVVTPSAYRPLLQAKTKRGPPARREFAKIMDARLIRVFEGRYGAPIEVYALNPTRRAAETEAGHK
ncbi:hypothetical protein [Marilutibacter maris]|uniref:Glycosyltransferase RgtA/B/C/D-like domain-containing protein n=1 Tax=Marilutibacter maris TaxID=1605891 RepID=A0A2U9T5E7_9GAMM|nr:hypothetical protein [Lysobacter maris]AWV06417.1 hypothetical protein C9I47_0696 [Lysobacter maris]